VDSLRVIIQKYIDQEAHFSSNVEEIEEEEFDTYFNLEVKETD